MKSTRAAHPWLAVLSLALGSFANITAEFLPSAGMFTFTVNAAIALGAALGGVIVDYSGLSATLQTGAAIA